MIGRDHLDSGSVASPYRETEGMADGSDAIADWPLLNALVNTASGASWVSIHHGGGVGIGRSIHAGMVCVADGTDLAAQKLERVLTADPGTGVIRHADAGYERAIEVADERGVRIPMREGDDVTVREIVTVGDPVLRERAREVTPEELRSPEVQGLIDDMIDTMRAADGAGLAANQVGERAAGRGGRGRHNPRYPYKPPIPLTVIVNPEIEPLDDETVAINEGCLSVPDLRGELDRHVTVRVRYLDRDGAPARGGPRGLTAGTFQHEVDHLDGVLFLDRVATRARSRPGSSSTATSATRSRRDRRARGAGRLVTVRRTGASWPGSAATSRRRAC